MQEYEEYFRSIVELALIALGCLLGVFITKPKVGRCLTGDRGVNSLVNKYEDHKNNLI